MAEHRFHRRRHWPALLAAVAVMLGLCGIALSPLFQANGPIGANRPSETLVIPTWPRLTSAPSPRASSTPSASPAPSSPAPPSPTRTGNLLAGPGADHVPGGTGDPNGAIAGWTILEGGPAVVRYGTDGFPGARSPGPADRGANFFDGGTAARSRLSQTVTLPDPTMIDAGDSRFSLSGLLGGFDDQEDAVTCTVTFVDADGSVLSTAKVGPVTATDRGGVTGLFQRTTTGTVPVGARTARVEMLFIRAAGTANDGYADSLLLDVSPPDGS